MGENPLDVLPDEIKVNIFCRLPIESVLDCKLVCRGWRRDLLRFRTSTTYFANLHLRYQYGHGQQKHKTFEHYHYGSDSNTISFVGFDTENQPRDLWYLEYYNHDDGNTTDENQPNYCLRKVNLELHVGVGGLVGSVNGLICLTAKTEYNGIPLPPDSDFGFNYSTYTANEPLYICNPITREFVNLPGILIDEKKSINGVYIAYGFGYHPVINKYKVVRIWYLGHPGNPSFDLKGQVEVYTLGSGSGWRSLGETNHFLWCSYNYSGDPAGFCVNGALHWRCDDSSDIVVFDLADEKFHLLRSPITRPLTRHCRHDLKVIGGCLCLEHWYSPLEELELWVLKKNKEEDNSSSNYDMNEQYYESWSWSRELVMPSTYSRWSILSHHTPS